MSDKDPTALADNDRFVLGEINAVVKSLPSRMDRFETQTSGALSEIRAEFRSNMQGLQSRVATLEQGAARHSGVSAAVFTGITAIAAFIATLFSGFLAFILGKH
jgi:hypothetical protein